MKKICAGIVLAVAMIAAPVQAETIKIAAWNIENLRAQNEAGSVKRQDDDYEKLGEYAARLDADIIALQEVEGPEAAARVFDPNEYRFLFSDRNHVQRTGFAVRRSIEVIDDTDFVELSLGGSVRRGTDITVSINDQPIRLLSVHLKSGCFDHRLTRDTNACNKLQDQVPILERWIDDRSREGVPFIVLGDFNRRFDTEGRNATQLSHVFYPQIDDGDPVGLDLSRLPEPGARSRCSNGKYPVFIDHIVLDEDAMEFLVPGSFQQLVFTAEDERKFDLSDHCPIAVSLKVN